MGTAWLAEDILADTLEGNVLTRLRRYKSLFRLHNTLDFSRLEPGDLVLVANPTDPPLLQAVLFWSHVAIYVGESEDHAFVDAVNLPVREVERRRRRSTRLWSRVRFTSLRTFRSYVDVLALRPDAPAERRRAAAEFARAQVGKPFRGQLLASVFQSLSRGRHVDFTCSTLVWEAYRSKGINLASGPLRRPLVPWPSRLGHDRRLVHLGGGTRYRPLAFRRGQVTLFLVRFWFRWVLRSDVSWRGEPDPQPDRHA